MLPDAEEIKTIINIISQYVTLTEEEKKEIVDIITNINASVLYNSKIHGIYHSQKVFLFSYLIAKHENLNNEERQIIFDAALYHDIGRINDFEDTLHGYCSALRIDKIATHPIYKNEENLKILKAIVDGHSVVDDKKDRFIEDYEVTNVERYYKLYNILKDADALDRKRFFESSYAHLDERYLRLDYSKKLIKLSEEINSYYKNKILESKKMLSKPEVGNFLCYHSIGFDFFKMRSILEYGILSKREMKKYGIQNVVNFEGGNLDDYVSVVDARFINKGTAYYTFITNGVSFVCELDKLYNSNKNHTLSYCIENGLPYNKSFHDDEKYVYGKIAPENIQGIFLHNKIINKDIRELNYIYNSLSFNLFTNRLKYYIENISTTFIPDTSRVKKLLNEYQKELEHYYLLDVSTQNMIRDDFIKILEIIREKINVNIQNWMYQKFQLELMRKDYDKIAVEDVVLHELKKLGIEYTKNKTKDGIVISYQKIKTKSK